MKSNVPALLSTAILLAVAVPAVLATPVQRDDLPADPSWIIHVDCDALRPTTLGKFLADEMEKLDTQAKIANFQSVFNLDLRTQLHGLTLYSLSGTPDDGVLLVYADFDKARLTTLAQGATDYQSTIHNQHVIHNWVDQEKKPKKPGETRIYAAMEGRRIIFGRNEAAVAGALDVLDGTAANLSASKAYPQLGKVGKYSFAQAAARKLDISDKGPQAAIFRLAKGLRLELGESHEQATATLSVDASGEEVAGQIAAIGQGLMALLKLQSEKAEVVKLAEAITIKQDGATVVARLAMPAASVVELIKADASRKAHKKAAAKHVKAEE